MGKYSLLRWSGVSQVSVPTNRTSALEPRHVGSPAYRRWGTDRSDIWHWGADVSAPQQIAVGEPTGRFPSKLALGSRHVGSLGPIHSHSLYYRSGYGTERRQPSDTTTAPKAHPVACAHARLTDRQPRGGIYEAERRSATAGGNIRSRTPIGNRGGNIRSRTPIGNRGGKYTKPNAGRQPRGEIYEAERRSATAREIYEADRLATAGKIDVASLS